MQNIAAMPTLDDQVREVQRHYPRIYVACHANHRARRGRGAGVSARDQTILAHVPPAGIRSQDLAAHLAIARSTMSEALKGLATMRLVDMAPLAGDARARLVRLTDAGRASLSRTSVLEFERVKAALGRLSPTSRRRVVSALAELADAAQIARVDEGARA